MGSSPSIHDVNAERAERIAIVIQNRILSNPSPFVEKMENVLWDALRTDGSAGPPLRLVPVRCRHLVDNLVLGHVLAHVARL